jgi:hypothetical protein
MRALSAVRTVPVRMAVRLHSADREAGMTTAEYAVGTVAARGFSGVPNKGITSPQVLESLKACSALGLQAGHLTRPRVHRPGRRRDAGGGLRWRRRLAPASPPGQRRLRARPSMRTGEPLRALTVTVPVRTPEKPATEMICR